MNRYPAIALLEFSSIASGIFSSDAMVKRAPINVLKSGTVHEGKYLILIGGSVASVEEAYFEGQNTGGDQIVDRMILTDVHEQVHDAILGARRPCHNDSLGVIETCTVATTIRAADGGVKGADVDIVEIRLADDLGGKAIALFTGKLEEVEAAIEIARGSLPDLKAWHRDIVIPRLHPEMSGQIDQSTTFSKLDFRALEGGEI